MLCAELVVVGDVDVIGIDKVRGPSGDVGGGGAQSEFLEAEAGLADG